MIDMNKSFKTQLACQLIYFSSVGQVQHEVDCVIMRQKD